MVARLMARAVLAVIGSLVGVGPTQSEDALYHAGFRVEHFEMTSPAGRPQILTCAVWYPTQAEEGRYQYRMPSTIGQVARDADPDREHGPCPLILYSHGYSGGGIAATFFTEHLARHGFVVVAPDHSDHHQLVRTVGPLRLGRGYLPSVVELARSGPDLDFDAYSYRPIEARAAIDGMLELNGNAASPLAGLIDPERIGAVGHSFGSFTTLSLAGLQPKYADARIKAILPFSGGIFMWRPEDWERLSIPVMIVYGENEWEERERIGVTDVATLSRQGYEHCKAPKFLLALKGAVHMTFCQHVIRGLAPEEATGLAAEQVRAIQQRGLAFLQRYVAGTESAEEELLAEDAMWTEVTGER